MKKFFLGTMFAVLAMTVPMSAMAKVDIHVSIPLPPPIVFSAPPAAVVIPDTYVYAFPDVREDIFFYDGWWWRSWQGRWYRSRHHDSGWVHYQHVPAFYSRIPANWKDGYRNHRWQSREWNYERIPQGQLQKNWRSWERNKYWEKRNNWGVQGSHARQVQHSREMKSQSHPQQPQPDQSWGNHERGGYDRQGRR